MDPTLKPGSPLWWLERLDAKRRERNKWFAEYDAYYEGDHPLVYASEQFRLAFGDLYDAFADNWMRLVVDAVRERLTPTGFSLGEGKVADVAWRWWQQSQMDAKFQVGLTEGLKAGEFSVSVWRDPKTKRPLYDVEDPTEVIVAHAPGSSRKRRAGIKVWTDEWTGEHFANVAIAGEPKIYKYRASGALVDSGLWTPTSFSSMASKWAPREDGDGPEIENPLGVVPFIPILNNPRLRPDKKTKLLSSSEIKTVIPNQDAVNKLVADMMLTSEAAGFPAKWASGVTPPRNPVTGELIEGWQTHVLKMLTSEKPDARFGTFDAADLQNNVKAIESRIQAIASQSRTPPHYFYLRGEFPSGESLKSAEAGLTSKSRDKITIISEDLEELTALGWEMSDEPMPDGGLDMLEALWADVEYHTESQRADAKTKLVKERIIPREQAQIDLGYSPTERNNMRAMFRREQVDQLAMEFENLDELEPEPAV